MSGIAGIVGAVCSPADWTWAQEATQFMAFRGPDALSVWRDERAALGHALLRTEPTDVVRGSPLTLDGDVWAVADARLDARDDVVRALCGLDRAVSLATPDAELVLHAYLAWGDACLDRLSGDFVFAIWDRRRNGGRLLVARDQLGIAPVYFASVNDVLRGGRLLFSNTMEALLLHPGVSDALDERAMAEIFYFGLNLDPATTSFSNIQRLPAAHVLTWTSAGVAIRRYWDAPSTGAFTNYKRAEDYVDHFRELFTKAVADRLRTDRATVQLSGGMDSTSVAAVCKRVASTSGHACMLRGVTAVLADPTSTDDEGHFAQIVADELGIETEFVVAERYPVLDPLARPEIVTPEATIYRDTAMEIELGKRQAAHARVVVSGLGGDTLLMFDPVYWMNWLREGRIRTTASAVSHHLRLFRRPPHTFARATYMRWRSLSAMSRASLPMPDWIAGGAMATGDMERGLAERAVEARTEIGTRSMATSAFWSNALACADPGFSTFPVKFHHPFFDLRLFQFALALPPVPWLVRKSILRDAMASSLPEAVLRRPKVPLREQPMLRRAHQTGADHRLMALVDATPALDRFVDRARLAARLHTLGDIDARSFHQLRQTVGVAQWLHHWRRPVRPAQLESRLSIHAASESRVFAA